MPPSFGSCHLCGINNNNRHHNARCNCKNAIVVAWQSALAVMLAGWAVDVVESILNGNKAKVVAYAVSVCVCLLV